MSNTGWICPVCNKGVAPHIETCPCNGQQAIPLPQQPYYLPFIPTPQPYYSPTFPGLPNPTWTTTCGVSADIPEYCKDILYNNLFDLYTSDPH